MADLETVLTKEEQESKDRIEEAFRTMRPFNVSDLRICARTIDRLASLVPAAEDTPAAVPEGVRGWMCRKDGFIWLEIARGENLFGKSVQHGKWFQTDVKAEWFSEPVNISGVVELTSPELATAYADWRKGRGAT